MARTPKIYTRSGDDGTTGLLFGGRRVLKNSPVIEANGVVDEAQAAIGVARAESPPGGELDSLLIEVERDLWVLMAEVATAPDNRHKLVARQSLVTPEMVSGLEVHIDDLKGRFELAAEFTVPGQTRVAALLDVARTVVRRGERLVLTAMAEVDSQVGPYLNRLSDLLWTLARWQEGEHLLANAKIADATSATGRSQKKSGGTQKKSSGTKKTASTKKTAGTKKAGGTKKRKES
jgi:cob(I)alamin adenosyltransferase